MRISTIDPATMTAGAINKELERLAVASSANTDAMIAAGRGYERPTEWVGRTDPLTVEYRALNDRHQALRLEVAMRMGPGSFTSLPTDPRSRRFVGPRKKVGENMPAPKSARRTEANPRSGVPIASDVQVIVYRHAETGKYMAHVFGGGATKFRLLHGRQVIAMDDLPQRTGVRMFGNGDAVILRHKDGKPLSEDFD